MTYDHLEWRRATAEYREHLVREKKVELLAAIEEPTRKEVERAQKQAEGHAIRVLWNTKEYNGVANPTWDDPIWRDPSKTAGLDGWEPPSKPIEIKAPERKEKATKTDIKKIREALRARS